MTGNLWRFFQGLAVWEGIVFLPVAVSRSGFPMQIGDLAWVLPIALCGVLTIVVCSLLALKVGRIASVSLGALSGVVLMIACGFLWAHIVRGFEDSAGALGGSLMLAIPSGFGSGIASWLMTRSSSSN